MTIKNLLVLFITLAALVMAFAAGPLSQDPVYHQFADQRTVLGVPNGCNVLSNILFVLFGAWGMACLFSFRRQCPKDAPLPAYYAFFAGVMLIGLGSAWYHIHPSDASLVWDRLPMSITFMALLSLVISESVNARVGALLLIPLLAAGMFSVGYWAGTGDLKPYAVVQFLPLVLIPLMLLLYKTPVRYSAYIWLLLLCYGGAKLLEYYDAAIYSLGNIVSGHTLKHVLAALGTALIVLMLQGRRADVCGDL